MPMAPTLSRPLARSPAVLEAERQESLHDPLDAGDVADRSDICPATVPIEDQRERAQQEFKQIWNLCTLTH